MNNVIEMRGKQLNIRLSEEEEARFQVVADHYGLNIAGTIRMLFKAAEREIAAEPVPLTPADEARVLAFIASEKARESKAAKAPKPRKR